jgi:lipopolysaccharide transport system ATP-binding protein
MNNNISMSLSNIGYSYTMRGKLYSLRKKKFWALKDVNFTLFDGEALGIIGRNGVGKSTLLRLMAGIIKPEKGKLKIYNKSVSLLSLQVGFLEYLTGRKNIILSALLLGLTYEEIESLMLSIIKFSELDDFIDQPINTYSSGMKARLGFSIGFHCNPDILLIDEVFSVGDENFRRKSSDVMKKKIKSKNTVVIVSHSPAVLLEICERVVWINDGITMAEGKSNEVIKEYQSFIKTLNTR